MPQRRHHRFSNLDYFALGISFFLALLAWLVHNLSLTYSSVAQCTVVASSSIDGHADLSSNSAKVASRCELTGYQLLNNKILSFRHKSRNVFFAPEYFHHRSGDIYYLDKSALTRYFHEMFGDGARLEYFITDSVFFDFPKMNFKKVPVHAAIDIDFKDQYMATSALSIMPDSLLVYGREEQIRGIDRLNTKVIQLRGVDSDCFGEVEIESIPSVRVSTSKVGYSISVDRYFEQVVSVPVRLVDAPVWTNVDIVPSSARVTLRMPFTSATKDLDRMFVSIKWSSLNSSHSGVCVGEVDSFPEDVISLKLEPEVFNCIVH